MDLAWTADAPTSGGPVWQKLSELVSTRDVLLHGSRMRGLTSLVPRTPRDRGPDAYSKSTGVFATEDPTWAMAYALRDESSHRLLNACFHPLGPDGTWGARRLFLSYARPPSGSSPLSAGTVYAVPRRAFSRMPPHCDPALGSILECQWTLPHAVSVVAEVQVMPSDLPLEIHVHDHDRVSDAMATDPHGFPWLNA